MTDQELTAIYKRANGIGEGKNPPISTKFIFAAMRESAKEALAQAAELIRADKWPTPQTAYHHQYNQQVEALALRIEQIGETK